MQLLNNILDSGKSESGSLEVDPKPTNLRKIFEDCWSIYSGMLKSKGLGGMIKVSRSIPKHIMIDRTRMF